MATLVALHGFTGRADAFRPVPDGVSLPLVGHDPVLPAAGASWDSEVGRISGEVERIGGAVHLVGYSMGARLALAVAVARPELVARLSLIGVHPGLPSGVDRDARALEDEVWCRRLEQEGIDAFEAAWESQPLWASQRALPAEVLAAQRAVRRAHDPRELAGALRALGLGRMPCLIRALAGIDAPVDVIVGEMDAKFRPLAEGVARTVRRGTVHVVAGAGHNVVLEQPAAVARLLTPSRG